MATEKPRGNLVSGQEASRQSWRSVLIPVIAFAATFWLLRETYAVAMPLTLALLLALAVWPLVRLIGDRMPKRLEWIGAAVGLLVLLMILAVFLLGFVLVARQIYQLAADFGPQLREQLAQLPLTDFISSAPDQTTGSLISFERLVSSALTALGITTRTVGAIVLIVFLVLLMMTEAENWHDKISALADRRGERRWMEIGSSIGEKFRAYFTTRLILGSLTAVLYVTWLALFGIDYLLLWGILAVLLNFIPTVGSIIAGSLPVLYALVTRDLASAAIVAGGLLVIEQVMGNFVDPMIMGRRLAISPLVALISLAFWSIPWGIPGAFLAVPLTVLITIVMAHFERLKPAALLLTSCSNLNQLDTYRHPSE